MRPDLEAIAVEVASAIAQWPEVVSVVEGGSRAAGSADDSSDIDLYVYSDDPVPLERRRVLVNLRADGGEIGNTFWEDGDEWVERRSGVAIDVIYRRRSWIEGELTRVLDRHEASIGYSTAIWHNVCHSRIRADRGSWFEALQARALVPFPEALVRSIVAKNYLLLRDTQSAFRAQIQRAASRRDLVSINHRVTAFLASYFDVLFALNRMTHPGEKRLLATVAALPLAPARMPHLVERLLKESVLDPDALGDTLDELVDDLDDMLVKSAAM